MKIFLTVCLLISAFLFTGCEAIVEERRPVRYGTVYDNDYRRPQRDYNYDDGRRYDDGRQYDDRGYRRDNVVVVNRPVVVEERRVYVRSRPQTVVKRVDSRSRSNSSDERRDARDDAKKKKKKKDEDR